MTIHSAHVSVSGIRIHYLAAGDTGPPLLLLHGGGTDSAALSWGHLLDRLGARHRVIAPDWPGYGESDRPEISHTIQFYVSILTEMISLLGIGRPSLVGVSMGGAVALGYALDQPQAVEKLILVDSYGLQDRAPAHLLSYLFVRLPLVNEFAWSLIARSRAMARASLQAIFHDPHRVSEGLVDEVLAELRRPGAGAAFRSFQKDEARLKGMKTVYLDRLDRLTIPTLIVHGAQDNLVPVRSAREAHARLPDSRLRILPEAGHWAQREQPGPFLEAVLEFLHA